MLIKKDIDHIDFSSLICFGSKNQSILIPIETRKEIIDFLETNISKIQNHIISNLYDTRLIIKLLDISGDISFNKIISLLSKEFKIVSKKHNGKISNLFFWVYNNSEFTKDEVEDVMYYASDYLCEISDHLKEGVIFSMNFKNNRDLINFKEIVYE